MSEAVKDQEMLKNIKDLKVHDSIDKFNLAYVKYKEGNLPEARAILEHLRVNGLFSEEVEGALAQVKRELQIELIEQEYSDMDKFILSQSYLPNYFYPALGAIFLLVFMILMKKKKWILGAIPLVISGALIGLHLSVKSFQVEINLEEVTIYKGPSTIFEEAQILPPGVEFIVTKTSDDWRFIEYPSIFSGWIHKGKAINNEFTRGK